jgi:HK97 gp10 family phage protein
MGSWKGYSNYGTSALGIDFSFKGLDDLLNKIEMAGKNIDDAAADAVQQAATVLLEAQKEGAARHRKGAGKYGTDAVYDAIESGHVFREANFTSIQIGIDLKKHPEAAHAVFQEYGDGHSPEFPDPFIRPSVDMNRSRVKSVMRAVLKKWGVPVE